MVCLQKLQTFVCNLIPQTIFSNFYIFLSVIIHNFFFCHNCRKRICQSSNQKYYLLNTEKCFQKQQTNVCSFYRKYNFFCANNLLISSKTTEKKLQIITDKNMQKLLKIVFEMNYRNFCVECTEKKLVCLQIDCKHLQCKQRWEIYL